MRRSKILFYYPSNKRTIALETLLIQLQKGGYKIIILTTCCKGDFHFYMESLGFEVFTNEVKNKGIFYYIKQILFLIKFCKEKKIDIINSHLQHVNFIAVLSQYFITSKLIVFRHHFRFIDTLEGKIKINSNEILFDKVINFLAKTIVVPSFGVYNGIKNTEMANMEKFIVVPYIYDFSKYQIPNSIEVQKIKLTYSCQLRLIMVSRLIKLKRHAMVFGVIKELINLGYDIKLLVLDDGPEKASLQKYILDNNLKDIIIMLGFRTDFANFMAASDLLIQPSLTDASNSAAKEISLFEKTVAVIKDVGDYDDYVIHNINGYLMPIKDSELYLKNIIIDAYHNPNKIKLMGQLLKKEVVSKFGISNSNEIMKKYEKLLQA